MITTTLPSWRHCGAGAGPADPVGCRGIRTGSRTACLAHLSAADRAACLAALGPGADVDFRGTAFGEDLLRALFDAVRDPVSGDPAFGEAQFVGASFSGDTRFVGVSFSGAARFGGASFSGDAWFVGASFSGTARFGGAVFGGAARFDRAEFGADARFHNARFKGPANFAKARFRGMGRFGEAVFSGAVEFGGTSFADTARFAGARFDAAPHLGPLVCGRLLNLSAAVFTEPVTIEAAAAEIACRRTRWESTAILRLRHARVDLTDGRPTQPIAVVGQFTPFASVPALAEQALGSDPVVRVASIRGVDASMLTLADLNLAECVFTGALHLDQLRLEGLSVFGTTPGGRRTRGPVPFRWTRRQVIEEERQWRALPGRAASARRGWGAPPPDPGAVPGLASLTTVYRQLRKAREDSKDEPGAADFYYGEMEMRRHSFGFRRAERWLLQAYWALSGYGLRAARALAWLVTAMIVSVFALTLWGVPSSDPEAVTTGILPGTGRRITLSTDTPPPGLTEPLTERFTGERVEKSVQVVLNSVIFRASGQSLTTAGTYIEMTSRLVEPGFLALALLAVRGRLKR
ncbi:pentapeptide repeat-containing protein [Streptomyces sp. NPDC059849]|uniref:pentapeptide repeat-containing protein n=1 Tax=Streptomyces sp. NPDC059849 TaxID=3346969 RepID=UPI0036640D5D